MRAFNFLYSVAHFLIVATMSALAQEWNRLDSTQIAQSAQIVTLHGTSIVYDSCGSRLIGGFGARLFESHDLGQSWYGMTVQPLKSAVRIPILITDSCTIYLVWSDNLADDQSRIAVQEGDSWIDRTPSFSRSYWTRYSGQIPFVADSLLLLYIGDVGKVVYFTSDRGISWDSVRIADDPYNILESGTFYSRTSSRTVGIFTKQGFFEFDEDRRDLTQITSNDSTRYAIRDTSGAILAAMGRRNTIRSLRRSIDNGLTWATIDTLHFDNAPPVPFSQTAIRRWFRDPQGGLIVQLSAFGIFAGTFDAGRTWHRIGDIPGGDFEIGGYNEMEHPDLGWTICSPTWIFAIRSWNDTVRVLGPSPGYVNMFMMIDSLHIVTQIGAICMYTTNGGQSWHVSRFSDHPDMLAIGAEPVSNAPFTRIRYLGNDSVRSNPYNAQAQIRTTRRQGEGYSIVEPLNFSRYFVPETESMPDWVRRGTRLKAWSAQEMPYGRPDRSAEYESSYAYDEDGKLWLAADSLWRSDDTGRTWTRVGDGLPRVDNGAGLLAISRVTRVSDNIVLAGARGIRTLEGIDTVDFAPGGIWMSTDNGVSWTRRDTGLGSRSCVWWIASVDDSVVLATVGEITYSNVGNEPNYMMSSAAIVRSNDTGRTWRVVFDEGRTRPAYTGQRKILVVDTSRILVTSIEDGVLESRDKGRTWQTIGGDVFTFQYVSDIDVDEEGGVYAGAWNGLYYLPPTSTSVIDEPRDHQRFTNVWARPVPTSSALIVRINNLDLLRGASSPTLHLYDMVGNAVADLTSELRGAGSTRQFEFTYDMASLDNGVYLLVLDTGKGKTVMKVMKVG